MSRLTLCVALLLAAAPAFAKGKSLFKEDGFYKVTTIVNGEELALTFIAPGDQCRQAQTNCASKSRIELQKFKGEPNQLWNFELASISPDQSYAIHPKISDAEDHLTGRLVVLDPDNKFLEKDKAYKQKHNRLSVTTNLGETERYFVVAKLPNGKFRITNLKGVEIKKPNEDEYYSKWNERRSLEGYKTKEGAFEVRNAIDAEVPAQAWAVTEVDEP